MEKNEQIMIKNFLNYYKNSRIKFVILGNILYLIQAVNDLFFFGNILDRPWLKLAISFLLGFFIQEAFFEKNKIYKDSTVYEIVLGRAATGRVFAVIAFTILYLSILSYANK